MKTKTAISFGLVDVNAKPDATFSTEDKQPFVNLEQLKRDELDIRKYATLEKDYFRLDETFELFPDEPAESDFGLWSASMRGTAGRNLLLNSSFLNDSGGSIIEYGIPFEFSEEKCIENTKSIKLDYASGDGSALLNGGFEFFLPLAEKAYVFSFYGKGWEEHSNISVYSSGSIYSGIPPISYNGWIKYAWKFEATADNTQVYIRPNGNKNFPFTAYINAPKLEKGNIATPWTPAPEDLEPLTIEFSEPHSSLGLTFTFHEPTDDYCTEMDIEWYNGTTLLSEKKFYPDNVVYFADNPVENYNKVVISFLETNKPYRYVKLSQIDFGQIKLFGSSDLTSANILEEVDPISSELRINTLDFNLHSKNAEFSILNPQGVFALLQQRQPLKVFEYLDGVKMKMGTYYLDEWENEDEHNINMKGIGLVGVIDGTKFYGGMYDGVAAGTIIAAIMTSIEAEYELDSSLEDITLSGYIPICTHREALQQVAFAIGAIANCSRSHKIRIYPAPSTVAGAIPKNRKFEGHKLKLKQLVTGVEVTAHRYTASDESVELLNDNLSAGTYEITFSEPVHSLTVSGATIVSSGVNYARINVTVAGNVILSGKKYTDSKQVYGVYNTSLSSGEKTNVLTVEEATLVSNSNAQAVVQRVYDYYQQRHQQEGEILLQNEECGQLVEIPSLNNQNIRGIIEKLDIDLTGGFIAEATITGGVV